jgi:hypothetical protein
MGTQPYTFDSDHRDILQEKILAQLNDESVIKPLKDKLDSFCQAAIDTTTDYIKYEYVLVLEDIVKERATRMVQELLKGNHEMAQFFALEKRIISWGVDTGKAFVYDPDGIRKSIVATFHDEILTAEIIHLQEENERISRDVKFYREMRDRY